MEFSFQDYLKCFIFDVIWSKARVQNPWKLLSSIQFPGGLGRTLFCIALQLVSLEMQKHHQLPVAVLQLICFALWIAKD